MSCSTGSGCVVDEGAWWAAEAVVEADGGCEGEEAAADAGCEAVEGAGAVVLVFAGRPQLVVLDEPTASLDVAAHRLVWNEISRYVAGGGIVLLTSHHLEEVEALAGRAVVLAGGRVVAEGSVTAIRSLAGLTRIRLAARPGRIPPGVSKVMADGGGAILLTAEPEPVLQCLVQDGASLAGIAVRPASLEEAFLELTGHPA